MTDFKVFFILSILTIGLSGCVNAAQEKTAAAIAGQEIATTAQSIAPAQTAISAKPRIIDFGSKQCKACKAMEPVLESLAKNHADKFITEFIDVWVPENEAFAKSHDISSIPTQVFLDANGKEIYRNVGFISEQDVLAKWAESGIISSAAAVINASDTLSAEPSTASTTTSGE